jgi:gluconolactonase
MPNLHSVPVPAGVLQDQAASPATVIAFTEGPAADAQGRVFFSDIWNNRVMCFDSRSNKTIVWRADSGRTNGNRFDPQGRLVSCEGNEFGPGGRRRITRTDMTTGAVEVLTDTFDGQPYNSPNDLAIRTNGQIFFTDPCYDDRSTMKLSHESVYRIDLNGQVTPILTQPAIQRPNGIALSPDERTLYLVDSCPVAGGNRKIWAFDLSEDGTPSRQRLVFDFAPGRGGDGMSVDIEGTLYIAAGVCRSRHANETTDVPTGIYVITPQGELKGRIPIPEEVITNCTFGGDDLKTLYVTAGKTLFRVRVQVPGWVVHRKV